jgi:ADP-ribose pyrophosphatase
MVHNEKTLNAETIHEGYLLKYEVLDVELLDGSKSTREIITHSGAVAILAKHEGKFYFVKQYRKAVEQALIEVPAGKLDIPGEDPLKCASRELQEEIGLKPVYLQKLGIYYPTPGYCTEKIHLYYSDQFLLSKKDEDPGEFLEIIKMSPKEVKKSYLNGEFEDGKTAALLGYYFSIFKY